jgi:hypothetical protein
MRLTFPRRHRRRWACSGSRMMSMGARAERMLAHRLVELERMLDVEPTPERWAEYYRVCDLWLRCRAPMPATPPITKAQLAERFGQGRGVVSR